MRAAAPVQVALLRFGVWQVGVSLVAAMNLIAIALWLMQTMPTPPLGVFMVGSVLALLVLAGTISLLRQPSTSLRWDGGAWHVGPIGTAGDEPFVGEIDVAIDLGAWMLLRFVPDAESRSGSTPWIPVQRRGLAPQWHALRCAVYSPRPNRSVDSKVDA